MAPLKPGVIGSCTLYYKMTLQRHIKDLLVLPRGYCLRQ